MEMETSIAVTTMGRGEWGVGSGAWRGRVIKKPLFGTRELCDFDVSGSARSPQKSQVRMRSHRPPVSETWQLFR